MSYITTKSTDTAGNPIKLHYADWGAGKPVIFIHGWPSTHDMWEYQMAELPKAGLRCIAYTRRGFGKSSMPWGPYDYDALASDLNAVIESLKLSEVTLVGFSMGGGEIARYLKTYGASKVSKVVLISTVLPFLAKTDDNPEGVPTAVFEDITEALKNDRTGFLDTFGKAFFGVGLLSHPVSEAYLSHFREIAAFSSGRATQECAAAFAFTDFRDDIPAITVPTLIIHGSADKTVPIEASSDRTAKMLPHAQYVVYDGAPHGLFYTEKDRLNSDLLAFIQ